MKFIFLTVYNYIRFLEKKIKCRNMKINGMQMLGVNSRLFFHKNSSVIIGKHCVSDGRFVIITDMGAKLTLGNNVYFNENCMISCKGEISIGNGCKFGPNVNIIDNNHKFDKINGVSNEHTYGKINIGEHCWIGTNVVILKGTTIGRNSVIGAGCVVSGNIPENSIVTQNRKLEIERMK